MLGFQFSKFIPQPDTGSDFDKLFKLFSQLLNYTASDAAEALDWMNQLDNQHHFTSDSYGMGDFIQDLKDRGYLKEDDAQDPGKVSITGKMEQVIRRSAFDEIFGKLKKSGQGKHQSRFTGGDSERNIENRPFVFGDRVEDIDLTASIRNAHVNHGVDQLTLLPSDLEVYDQDFQVQCSTVLMIDISHSMILYGEDRITPAKKVAMALSEWITTRYPKDTLDIIVFGNDAWQIEIKDLPYLQVGPFHTNTVAGLELAMDILRRRKNPNKQIFMITDGKPTCLKVGAKYYKNSFGLDRKIISKTLNLAGQCRKINIKVTTFMVTDDPYLQEFVDQFTEANQGKAFYSGLSGLGNIIFQDYERNRKRKI